MSLLATSLARRGRRRPLPPAALRSGPLVTGRDDGESCEDDHNRGHAPPRRCISSSSHLPLQLHSSLHPQNSVCRGRYAQVATRHYHATHRQEILPFLAVGFIGATAVYTYRAFQEMDREWDEYYDQLEEYKAATGIDPEAQQGGSAAEGASAASKTGSSEDVSSFFTGGTLAVDLGTSRLKLSHRSSLANRSNFTNGKPPAPTVSVDREGFRSTPALAWVPSSAAAGEDMLIGRLAAARAFDTKGGSIVHPREALGEDDGDAEAAVQQTLRAVATNALDQALGNSSGGTSNDSPLFVLDESLAAKGAYNVRPIFTVPPGGQSDDDAGYLERYQLAVNGLTSPAGIAAFVPEPVAIVAGAEYYDLLPPKGASAGDSVLVVDVGGTSTSVSVVGGGDEVLYAITLPFGGDTVVDLLVSHLVRGFYGTSNNDTGNSAESSEELSSKPSLDDPTALQRLYEASTTAVHELSNKTRSEINIPYLTMDLDTRQPKHLEMGIPRNVVDAEVEAWVQSKLVPYLQSGNDATTLSQALPPPTSLATLLSSAIMASLEHTSLTPHALRAVLLVGGGARIPLVQEATKEGVGYLAGDAYATGSGGEKRLIVPEGEMGEELGVLGAAVWGSDGR